MVATIREDVFKNKPISKAVLTLILPTTLSQLIYIIYNMADTIFVEFVFW